MFVYTIFHYQVYLNTDVKQRYKRYLQQHCIVIMSSEIDAGFFIMTSKVHVKMQIYYFLAVDKKITTRYVLFRHSLHYLYRNKTRAHTAYTA